MPIAIDVHLSYVMDQPCDLLLHIEAAAMDDQQLIQADLNIVSGLAYTRIPGQDGVGARIVHHVEGQFECRYSAQVGVNRPMIDLSTLAQTPLTKLPGDVVQYLMASRYCHLARFDDVIGANFNGLTGGAFVAAARDWIQNTFRYDSGVSNDFTNAHDSLDIRAGVCRDFAHVLITLARSVGIPARMVSAYAPDVRPQDFHAVAEVYLGGAWYLADPTGMARPDEIVRIGVGRDAADVSFLTAYGFLQLQTQTVEVSRV